MVLWESLLKKGNVFLWGDEHDAGLKKVKEIITNPVDPVLKHFGLALPIQLVQTDRGS